MKKFLISTFVLLFLVSLNVTALAASNTYELDELGLEITIPSGYSVITRDTPKNDHIFDELGITKSNLINQFENNHIYLNAISDTHNEEIVVTMEENIIDNFSLFSDTMLESIASSLVEQYSDLGAEITSHNIYQHSQAKFIKLYFKIQSEGVLGIQYYTVYDGKAINFTLRSYEDRDTYKEFYRQTKAIETIVNSVRFDKNPPTSKLEEDTASFIYTDTDSGISFTVPTNWKQKAFTEDREYLDVKFVSLKDVCCAIIFSSTDMWEQIPSSEKTGYNREDINHSFFTKSDIAEMYGITEDEISVVTYNGVQYYKGEITTSTDEYGFDISVTTTQLICINNGWMYMFQFGGTDSHALYSDFESLLGSIEYQNFSGVSNNRFQDNSTSSLTGNFTINFGNIVFIIIFLLAVLGIVVAVVVAKRRKSQSATINKTSTENKICKNCGQTLPSDSEFCHICGAKTDT